MKLTSFGKKRFGLGFLAVLGLNALNISLPAQPAVSYTVSGSSGHYTLDFTLNNTSPGTAGFDIYYFGVLANGGVSGNPSGYYSSSFATVHQLEVGTVYDWAFNDYWIDPTYTRLPTGETLSGFSLLDTDATTPASIPYFAYGENGGATYFGPDNENINNPSNPLFVGYALVVPEPAAISMIAGASVLLLVGRNRLRNAGRSSEERTGL